MPSFNTRQLKKFRASILMDESWYRQTYSDLRGVKAATQHYIEYGWAEGRSPSLYFDGPWYLERNPDIARAGVNPLIHYLDFGWREGRDPHPLFDTKWYLERVSGVSQSGIDPLTHYLTVGWHAGASPHPLFDPELYGRVHPQTKGAIPWVCYLLSDPCELQRSHLLFDPAWYMLQNSDVAAANMLPLVHYLRSGWMENRQPHPLFDSIWYVNEYPDVAKAALNPLLHYIRYGATEKRNPHPLFNTEWYITNCCKENIEIINPLVDYLTRCNNDEILTTHPLFHRNWYLEQNPDVLAAGLDPLMHYVQSGWLELRNPHPLFDARWYLHAYPDVAEAKLDPFRHYLTSGRTEARNPSSFFNSAWYRSEAMQGEGFSETPLFHYLSLPPTTLQQPHPLFDVNWYRTSYRSSMDGASHSFVDYVAKGIDLGRLPIPDFEEIVGELVQEDIAPRNKARLAFERILLDKAKQAHRDLGYKCVIARDMHYEVWRAPQDLVGAEICLFAAHTFDSILPASTLHYLRALRRESLKIILVVVSKNSGHPLNLDEGLVDGLIGRDDLGFDFASWALAFQIIGDLWKAQTIVFANDSVYGPIHQDRLSTVMDDIRQSDAGYIALTQSWQIREHYQSYFFAMKSNLIRHARIKEFWETLICLRQQRDVIERYEVAMLSMIRGLGAKTHVLFPLDNREEDSNPTLDHWHDLLDVGFPFIKIQVLRDDISGIDRSGWQSRVAIDQALRAAIEDHLASDAQQKRKRRIVRQGR